MQILQIFGVKNKLAGSGQISVQASRLPTIRRVSNWGKYLNGKV